MCGLSFFNISTAFKSISVSGAGRGPAPFLRILTVALATIAVGAHPAAAKIMSCQTLEQNCEAYVTHLKQALAHTRSDQAAGQDQDQLSVERCQAQYASARQTGLWPAQGVRPALPCSN
jgi:hypothetical protein